MSFEGISIVGFQAAGVEAGIKKHGGLDLALIVADQPCSAAAVFTQNRIQSPAVQFDRALLQRNAQAIQAVVINSGCANAVTGAQGHQNAAATAQAVQEALGLPVDSVCVMSTGVIGEQLPMPKLLAGIPEAAEQLRADGWHEAALAIMTTDTRPKLVQHQATLPSGAQIQFVGIAKGAGMIHPNMATLLSVVCTDAAIAPDTLQEALRYAADRSFNSMTIDGDSSTNDTLLVLSAGNREQPPKGYRGNREQINSAEHSDFPAFRDALTAACIELAKMVARDGEGATKFVTIDVTGARSWEDARQIGRTIATSALVKTAIYGTDANWGRIFMAAGRAGVELNPDTLALWFGDVQLTANGAPLAYSEADAHATLLGDEVFIRLDLRMGDEHATVWTCDFGPDYVSINADYRT
jgi:glutamate N-acetyltransferase/amino-acid N-acetyltransferase